MTAASSSHFLEQKHMNQFVQKIVISAVISSVISSVVPSIVPSVVSSVIPNLTHFHTVTFHTAPDAAADLLHHKFIRIFVINKASRIIQTITLFLYLSLQFQRCLWIKRTHQAVFPLLKAFFFPKQRILKISIKWIKIILIHNTTLSIYDLLYYMQRMVRPFFILFQIL